MEYVQHEWADNADTVSGQLAHRRVDSERGELPAPEELTDETKVDALSVLLFASSLGLIARIDCVEGANGIVRPVDYISNFPNREGPWDRKVQLCMQGLIQRENKYTCEDGILCYVGTKRKCGRFSINFDSTEVASCR